jgi:tRNA-uridine 2-sulfurtransferase
MSRIVLAMSGGVDSSVAAHLLLEAGHEVIGVFMRHGEESAAVCQVEDRSGLKSAGARRVALPVVSQRADHKQGCCTASDAADARRVAAAMKIPFYAIDLQQDFKRIVDYFVDDYLEGRTPNPCLRCNQWIKFGRLFDYADGVDAQYVATGHYARMIPGHAGPEMHRGIDESKDQSYALFGIRPDRLSRMLLPVGGFTKTKIREIAVALDLGVANKKDSQEICFVTQGHHSEFVRAKAPDRSAETGGDFVLTDGTIVGRHGGYEAFTIGQRKGLRIALGEPVYVVRIEPDTKRVVLGRSEDLLAKGLIASEANWLVDPIHLPESVMIQIRYNSPPTPGKLRVDPNQPGRFEVEFTDRESAVAPGQAAVIFDSTRVLGGGWIESEIT